MMKPRRPFGLTLAILAAWLFYTVIPLSITGLIFYINRYVYRDQASGMTSGMALTNFQVLPFTVVIAAAVLMAFVGLFTWIGRPAAMRYVFPALVFSYTLITLLGVLLPLITAQPTLLEGADSGYRVFEALFSGYTGMTLLLTIYTLWFCNRWSARAFFRGYYTEKDKRAMEAIGIDMAAL
ncbi:MAG: hypothetical protein SNJ54_00875 [Anaerolineae bacterium]